MNTLYKNVGYAAILVMLGVYVFLEMTGPRGLPELLRKRSRIEELQLQNAELQKQNRMRDQRIKRLGESQEEQELEIRRRYRKQKPGTVDFFLPPGEGSADQPSGESSPETTP